MDFERGKDPIRALDIGMYIYDNGFGPRWYVCNYCKSIRLGQIIRGGFQPPWYLCQDCGRSMSAPAWVRLNPKTLRPYADNRVVFKDPRK